MIESYRPSQFTRDRIRGHADLVDCRSELFLRHAPFLGPELRSCAPRFFRLSAMINSPDQCRENVRRTIRFKQFRVLVDGRAVCYRCSLRANATTPTSTTPMNDLEKLAMFTAIWLTQRCRCAPPEAGAFPRK